jgi:glycosyltransferase involved in cell wall biosynthesis
MAAPIRVLVVGQTPPPFHGQAIMIQMLVDGPLPNVTMRHVRMNFSQTMDQVGRFQVGKLLHLFQVMFAIIYQRIVFRPSILYYPPAGPNKVPILRDVLLLLTTRWMFRKTVFHFHANGMSELVPKLPRWIQFLVRLSMSRPDVAIHLSEYTSNEGGFLNARKVVIVPNAAEDHLAGFPRCEQSDNEVPRLLYLGTVCETKGICDLLKALRQINASTPFHLDVVGSFQPLTFRETVEKKLVDYGLKDKVTLHGQKTGDDKWRMLQAADIFCFPTYYESEGFPCVLVEAMSFELPIVSTTWRGIPSIVEDGTTGYLVKVRDVDRLAERLQKLLSDPRMAKEMGHRARNRFESRFTKEHFLRAMDQVFHDES